MDRGSITTYQVCANEDVSIGTTISPIINGTLLRLCTILFTPFPLARRTRSGQPY